MPVQVQLCFAGGGARGFAHLGVAEALLELGFPVLRYSGTSSGAIAAAFLAAGYHPLEVLDIFESQKLTHLFGGSLNGGLLKMDGLAKLLAHHLPSDFAYLSVPLIVSATDLVQGRSVFAMEGELFPFLLGSASIPGLFRPVRYRDMWLVDGGVLNNLPVEPLLDYPEPVVAIHCNPVGLWQGKSSAMAILERSLHLGVYSNTLVRGHRSRVFIEPAALKGVRVFDYARARQIYEAGYAEVMEHASKALADLG